MTLAPAARMRSISSTCRGLSRTMVTTSSTRLSSASATRRRLSSTGMVMSMAPVARGPTISLSMYQPGVPHMLPRGATESTAMAPSAPRAQ